MPAKKIAATKVVKDKFLTPTMGFWKGQKGKVITKARVKYGYVALMFDGEELVIHKSLTK